MSKFGALLEFLADMMDGAGQRKVGSSIAVAVTA
jgi:hypothetical protein